jgi:hypothetical protein
VDKQPRQQAAVYDLQAQDQSEVFRADVIVFHAADISLQDIRYWSPPILGKSACEFQEGLEVY